jgi:hypothetical protein
MFQCSPFLQTSMSERKTTPLVIVLDCCLGCNLLIMEGVPLLSSMLYPIMEFLSFVPQNVIL